MNLWEMIDRRLERSHALRIAKAAHPRPPLWHWPDARGWIGIALVGLTIMILWMIKSDVELRKDEFFKTIAVLIIGTGFINGVVSWAYAATKQGGELAERSAAMVERQAEQGGEIAERQAASAERQAEADDEPQDVVVINEPHEPVPTEATRKRKP